MNTNTEIFILKNKFIEYKTDKTKSLRTFAKLIDIDAGTLSRILNRKRFLTLKTASKIIRSLNLTKDETNVILSSVLNNHGL
jgi:plasmid maintenance system antidote protein VapI